MDNHDCTIAPQRGDTPARREELRLCGNGYSGHEHRPGYFRSIVHRVADALPDVMHQYEADAVVVTGKSGISVAFAALMLIDFPLVIVRKPGENSHGFRVEGPEGAVLRRYIILDDFVSSGATVTRVRQQLIDEADRFSAQRPRLVAVAVYAGNGQRATHGVDVVSL